MHKPRLRVIVASVWVTINLELNGFNQILKFLGNPNLAEEACLETISSSQVHLRFTFFFG